MHLSETAPQLNPEFVFCLVRGKTPPLINCAAPLHLALCRRHLQGLEATNLRTTIEVSYAQDHLRITVGAFMRYCAPWDGNSGLTGLKCGSGFEDAAGFKSAVRILGRGVCPIAFEPSRQSETKQQFLLELRQSEYFWRGPDLKGRWSPLS